MDASLKRFQEQQKAGFNISEKLGESIDTAQDNADYRKEQEEASQTLPETKANAGKIFGNNFDPERFNVDKGTITAEELADKEKEDPENGQQEINEQQEVDMEKLKNSPELPILEGLLEGGYITDETFEKIAQELIDKPDGDAIEIIINAVSSITSIDEKEKKQIIDDLQGSGEVNSENFESTNFFKDMESGETGAKPEGSNLDFILAESYINLSKLPQDRNLNMTMDIALAKIIKQNGPDFEGLNGELIKDIRATTDQNSLKYMKLTKLNKLSIQKDAPGAKKQVDSYKGAKKKIEVSDKSLTERFNEFQQNLEIAKQQKNNEALQEQLEILNSMVEEVKASGEVISGSDGEVYTASDLEVMQSEIQEIIKEEQI